MFDSILFDAQSTLSVEKFLILVGVSLFIGLLYVLVFSFRNESSKTFRTAIFFLPAVICVVIMMINKNFGIGVAVAGAFSLIRFRSSQGNAKEIAVVFMTMCSGLIAGVGYVAYSILFSLIMCAFLFLIALFGPKFSKNEKDRVLKISIPEDLDYTNVFDDIFNEMTSYCSLEKSKTANMGSIYKLTYNVKLKNGVSEKAFMDKLRERNGNLEIALSRYIDDGKNL